MRELRTYAGFLAIREGARAGSLVARLGGSPDHPDYLAIKSRLERMNRTGLLEWFVKRRFADSEKMADLHAAMDLIASEPNLVKQMATPVAETGSLAEFRSLVARAREDSTVSRTLARFLPWQKRMLDASDPETRRLLLDLSAFKGADAFFSNVKRYSNAEQIASAIEARVYHEQLDWDALSSSLGRAGVRPCYTSREGSVMVARVDYRQLRRLASHTEWCTLDRKHWDVTVRDLAHEQWIVFLLDHADKYSTIGTTTAFSAFDGSFLHTETRLADDEPISTSELESILGARGVPPGSFRRWHEEALVRKLSRMRSWDQVPLPVLLAIGAEPRDIVRKKARFAPSDLDSLESGRVGPVGQGVLIDLDMERAVDSARRAKGRAVSEFDRALSPAQREQLGRMSAADRSEVEAMVVGLQGDRLYSALLASAAKDYGTLQEVVDRMRMILDAKRVML